MKNKVLFQLLFSIIFNTFWAQTHTQMWMRASFHYNIDKKWSSTLELNHRTQSLANTESPFRYPMANAVRLWIVYKLNPNHNFIFSPYAFFSNDPAMNNLGDELKPNVNEHRMQIQYENKLSLDKKWTFRNREGLEYRIFETNSPLLRLRLRESIGYQFNKQFSINLYDELFINTININFTNILDQNRIGVQATYSANEKIKLEFGSNLIHQKPRNSELLNSNYMFFMNILYLIH